MAEEKIPKIAEDDDLARARAFWNDNGKSIIAGVIIGLGSIVGFNGWQSYKKSQGENASILFEQIHNADESLDIESVANELKNQYKSSTYAILGALAVAKHYVENDNLESAAVELKWALDNTSDTGFEHITRLRLAVVQIAQNDAASALSLLEQSDMGSFESRYHELKGDAYVKRAQQGDSALAKSAYQTSLETLEQGAAHARLIQLKMDNVGES